MFRTSSIVLMSVLLIALIAGGVYYFHDTEGPVIVLQPEKGPVSSHRPLLLTVRDEGSGLRSLRVTAHQGEKDFVLFDQPFPLAPAEHQESLSLAGLKLESEPFELRVEAVDGSIYHFGRGTARQQTFSLDFDARPPVLSIRSRQHNLAQGGAGLVIYAGSEELTRTGVLVGERFFPAYRQPSGDYACLFSLPYDADTKNLVPKLVGEDLAGNERQTGFTYYASRRPLPTAKINLSDAFLQEKMPNFQHLFPETDDLLQIFLKVNRELRTSNRAKLLELGRQSSSEPLWRGAFEREPGANREAFATVRGYYYQGKKVDQQIHLGIDLASVAQGPVHAENRGRVIYADDFGIYGQCVIIDHGLGLMSLYGHMSSIAVAVGDLVEKGQEIGRTGATGLAGGDHLHLGILVAGLPVNPVEWWDPSWVRNNITSKLELLREPR